MTRGAYGEMADALGPIGRVNGTQNVDNQPGDHNRFQQAIDANAAELLSLEADFLAGGGSPAVTSLSRQFAGITYWPGCLDRFRYFDLASLSVDIVNVGDSTTQNTLGSLDSITERLGRAWGREIGGPVGNILGPGFRGLWRDARDGTLTAVQQEWLQGREFYDLQTTINSPNVTSTQADFRSATDPTLTFVAAGLFPPGTTVVSCSGMSAVLSNNALATTSAGTGQILSPWSQIPVTALYDVAPFGEGWMQAGGGVSKQLTWRKPVAWRPIVAVDIFYIDFPGCAANWTYRLDNGAWINAGAANVGDNKLKRLRIAGAVTKNIALRAESTVPAAAPCAFAGIVPYYANPDTTPGLTVHNLGRDGGRLADFTRTTTSSNFGIISSGDPMAILSGHPGSLNPTLLSQMFANDILYNNTATWAANLNALIARAQPICDLVFGNIWEQGGNRADGTLSSTAMQTLYRAMTKTVAQASKVAVVDMYDLLAAYGYTGYAAVLAAGLIRAADVVHPTQPLVNIEASAIHRLAQLA